MHLDVSDRDRHSTSRGFRNRIGSPHLNCDHFDRRLLRRLPRVATTQVPAPPEQRLRSKASGSAEGLRRFSRALECRDQFSPFPRPFAHAHAREVSNNPGAAGSRLGARYPGRLRSFGGLRRLLDDTIALRQRAHRFRKRDRRADLNRRRETVRYAGVLAPASAWRARIAPRAKAAAQLAKATTTERPKRAGTTYRPWAELLARTFSVDVLECPNCRGRMKLIALVKDPKQISRFLSHLGEPTDAPRRAANRGPPFWKSTVLRQRALGQVA